MESIFMNKAEMPTKKDLKQALGECYSIWQEVENFTCKLYANAAREWNFSGSKYGWSFRIKDKKRAIIYLLPRDKFFKVALVFGKKAFEEILQAKVAETIKAELRAARVYAEGRGIRIGVKDWSSVDDIKELVKIKLSN